MLLTLALFFFAASTPSTASESHTCFHPRRRVEWTTLKTHQKEAYFTAEKCLLSKPSRDHFVGAVTRYDDLIFPRQQQNDVPGSIDTWLFTGQSTAFTSWPTRPSCGMNVTTLDRSIPYWNELPDAGNFNASRVIHDFGGEGSPILTGPFSNLTVNLGPGKFNTPHLLSRKFNEVTPPVRDRTMLTTLQVAGHVGVGGDMLDFMTSSADPLFWLHHTYLDMLWWKWQGNNSSRINDFENIGHETHSEPPTGYTNTTKDTLLSVYGIIPDVTVGDVLKTEGGYLCYTYDI